MPCPICNPSDELTPPRGVSEICPAGWFYRDYCRARLAEMRKQLLISNESHEVPEANCDADDSADAAGQIANPREASHCTPN